MFGLDFLSPHFLATSSGSVSLNSPLVPSQVMMAEFAASESSSRRNCHNWIWPEPWETRPRLVDVSSAYGSAAAENHENKNVVTTWKLLLSDYMIRLHCFGFWLVVCGMFLSKKISLMKWIIMILSPALRALQSIGKLEQMSWVALNINENLNNDYQVSEKSF